MITSKHVNMTHARQFAERIYKNSGQDARVFLYRDAETDSYDCMEEWDYYHGAGRGINEQDVYAMVFYGTGGYAEPPKFEIEYF